MGNCKRPPKTVPAASVINDQQARRTCDNLAMLTALPKGNTALPKGNNCLLFKQAVATFWLCTAKPGREVPSSPCRLIHHSQIQNDQSPTETVTHLIVH